MPELEPIRRNIIVAKEQVTKYEVRTYYRLP